MFKTDDTEQNKKLAEMDLDDILNRAEDHETEVEAGGTSLGGEAFLNSFAAVQDIRAADLSWDDIIPADTRASIVALEEEEKVVEKVKSEQSRKRAAAQLPGAYSNMMMEDDAGARVSPPPEPKKKKGGAAEGSTNPRAGVPTGPKKTAMQRSLELKGSFLSGREAGLRVLAADVRSCRGPTRARHQDPYPIAAEVGRRPSTLRHRRTSTRVTGLSRIVEDAD